MTPELERAFTKFKNAHSHLWMVNGEENAKDNDRINDRRITKAETAANEAEREFRELLEISK